MRDQIVSLSQKRSIALSRAIKNVLHKLELGRRSDAEEIIFRYYKRYGCTEEREDFVNFTFAVKSHSNPEVTRLESRIEQSCYVGALNYLKVPRLGLDSNRRRKISDELNYRLSALLGPPKYCNGEILDSKVYGTGLVVKHCWNKNYPDRVFRTGFKYRLTTPDGRRVDDLERNLILSTVRQRIVIRDLLNAGVKQ